MNNRVVYLPDVDENYTLLTHESGLKVCLAHKDLNTSYALLGVGFGSLFENCLVNQKVCRLPDGTAHFLEHKMFENKDGEDTFLKFSRTGANANAYTGTDRTCYLFSASEHFEESLEILLRSVFSPFFTKENVNKEKSIIIEELKMYRDDPDESIRSSLMRCMYRNSRVRGDICGTIQSIRKITPKELSQAYDLFYVPSNMVLSICGKFNEKRVRALLDELLPRFCVPSPVKEELLPETMPDKCFKRKATVYKDITTPAVALGIKGTPEKRETNEHLKRFNAMSVIAHALFSPSSTFVSGLMKDSLIPDDPSYEVIHTAHCSYIALECYTYDPREFIQRFEDCAVKLHREGIDKNDFERGRKSLYSDFLESFNSAEECAHLYMSDILEELDTEQTGKCIFSLTPEEVNALAHELLNPNRLCRLTILPQNQKNAKKGTA